MDTCHMNSQGRDLIEFCKCVGLLIVNGRVGEDRGIGEFSRVDRTGSSLVDHVICSPGLFKQFRSFQVIRKLPESDHKPLSYSLDCDRIEPKRGDHESVSWKTQIKYKWTHADLANIKPALTDDIADNRRQIVKEAMANMCDTNDVARFLDDMLSNMFDRTIGSKSSAKHNAKCRSRPKWHDRELTEKRHQAIQAGGHVTCHAEKQTHINACRDYRALRQRKQRDFHRDCLNKLENAMANDKQNMWKILKRFVIPTKSPKMDQLAKNFYDHFNRLAAPSSVDYFDDEYGKMASEFINNFESPITSCVLVGNQYP